MRDALSLKTGVLPQVVLSLFGFKAPLHNFCESGSYKLVKKTNL